MKALLVVVSVTALVAAQGSPSFEVISVKRNRSGERGMQVRTPPDGGLAVRNNTLADLIRLAYRLQEFQLAGGPPWLQTDRFDIVATGNGEASEALVMAKLKALLADRFRLVVRARTRELPIYAIVLARPDGRLGAQLRQSTADCTRPPGCGIEGQRGRLAMTGQPLSRLAESLSFRAGRMVVDKSGLTGAFDITLTWSQEGGGNPPDDGPSLFTAVQEQLGLRLDPQRGPVEVLVVDRAEPPTEN
jgi:uncharacterized protein (TIGR03435 family)